MENSYEFTTLLWKTLRVSHIPTKPFIKEIYMIYFYLIMSVASPELWLSLVKGPLGQSISITSDFSKKQDIIAIKDYVSYQVYEDQVYFGDTKKGFFFTVFDQNGNTVTEVNIKYKKLLITDEYKSGYFKWKSENPNWERYKKRYNYIFPKYFPAYRKFIIADNKSYFITYSNTGNSDEVIITDLKGNILKKSSLPSDPYNRTGSFDIYKGVAYYLYENEDEEMWELHAVKL